MFIDYENKCLKVFSEEEEDLMKLVEKSKFKLIRNFDNLTGSYLMPFIAFPILKMTSDTLKYKLNVSPAFKLAYSAFLKRRKELENYKTGKIEKNEFNIEVESFLDALEIKHGFKYFKLQRDSILFGIRGERCCIANDIGTGKTLTVISIIKYLIYKKLVKKAVIFVPASLVKNFHNDYIKFFGNEGVLSIADETKDKRIKKYFSFRENENFQFLITNYEKWLFDNTELQTLSCDCVVVDEFHKMRNFVSAKRSINFFDTISKIWKPRYRYPMSGTPIENRLFDLFPVFKFLDGGSSVGGQSFFEKNFIEYTVKKFWCKGKFGSGKFLKTEVIPSGFKNHEYLKNLIRPMVIRKKRELECGLEYKFIEFDISKKIKEKYEEIIKTNEDNHSLKYHSLRQFLCDVKRMGLEDTDNPKLDALLDIIEQTQSKVVVFSFYKCSIRCIEAFLNNKGYKCLKITGDENNDALEVIEEFKNSDTKILLATDRINFGVNIQCANVIVQYELPLKPSISEQRIGRLYRAGQNSDVLAVSFIVKKTVEEIIYKNFIKKEILIDTMIEQMDQKEENLIGDIKREIAKAINVPDFTE